MLAEKVGDNGSSVDLLVVKLGENGLSLVSCFGGGEDSVSLHENSDGEEAAEVMIVGISSEGGAELNVRASGVRGTGQSFDEFHEDRGDGEGEEKFKIFAAVRFIHKGVGPEGRSVAKKEIRDKKMGIQDGKKVHNESGRGGLGTGTDVNG